MSNSFWQAKIQGLLYDFDRDRLRNATGENAQVFLNALESVNPAPTVSQAYQIAEASDRALLNGLQLPLTLPTLKVAHLLSGAELPLSVNVTDYYRLTSPSPADSPPNSPESIDSRQLFWWLWRCLPEAVSQRLGEDALLMPAVPILPDASVWSQASLTAALAGALTDPNSSPPHLATFSFSPVQELIKASRKMRDFWAGSWVLHYLSAKICWRLAQRYGPDSLIYPSLFQQPLIDHWLGQTWAEFRPWIPQPSASVLLTAGFPNVIVTLLPAKDVKSAMQTARQTLLAEWSRIGQLVFAELKRRHWMPDLGENSATWSGWLGSQWQTYWTALPIGVNPLTNQAIAASDAAQLQAWLDPMNRLCQLQDTPDQRRALFLPEELEFMRAVYEKDPSMGVNVGSWWSYLFDQLRYAAGTVKNSRVWQVPTAFLPRSTVSGIGSVVYPNPDQRHTTEGDTGKYWERQVGLFDGIEELNATETLKRGLHQVLPQLLGVLGTRGRGEGEMGGRGEGRRFERQLYPDLSSGVAGWLRTHPQAIEYFRWATTEISQAFAWTTQSPVPGDFPPATQPWGIPWIEQNYPDLLNSRLLNAGWLIDEFTPTNPNPSQPFTREAQKQVRQAECQRVGLKIAEYFTPGNNPSDWYVLAAGDGDGMSRWLNGERLKAYQEYMPVLPDPPEAADGDSQGIYQGFNRLKSLNKRMGPATHNALSRALLDFSNRLVPYLTEQRYAGRLIYSGGDDVLAYTNLWEWDQWLWDIRQCFRGADDPRGEFSSQGDYWRYRGESDTYSRLPQRPLFTMGGEASLSFGVVIAHHSVPLAIALENLWSAEAGAKQYDYQGHEKDAVQVRVLFGSGNILTATSRFAVFHQWHSLLQSGLNHSLFEQAAQLWRQHPAPTLGAIEPWTRTFCQRREVLADNESVRQGFEADLAGYLSALSHTTPLPQQDDTIQGWLKLTAFILRHRQIGMGEGMG